MTRLFSLIISFYLTLALVQIPFVNSLMPGFVKDIFAPSEMYYISVITPDKNFDISSDEYYDNLLPMKRDRIEKVLENTPGIEKLAPDYYVYEGESGSADINLYTGDSEADIMEIEFVFPYYSVSAAPDLIDTIVKIAKEIPGSRIFDYDQRKLYRPDEKDKLISSVEEFVTGAD